MKVSHRMKKIIAGVIENATALCMVFVCFMLFTDILAFIFPSKLTSELTLSSDETSSVLTHPHWRQLLFAAGNKEVDLKAESHSMAKVVSIQNRVKSKRANAISWDKSQAEMVLYNQDALQTLSRSSATIAFGADNQARLGENTLVVIKHLEKDLIFNDKRTFMLLTEGTLRAKLTATAKHAAYMNLETPQATVSMHSIDGTAEAQVVAGPNQTSTISVYKGAIEVATPLERVTVHASQAIRVPVTKPIEALISLPRPVETLSPVDMAQLFIKEGRFSIEFSWRPQPDATGYHFMVARDSEFTDVIVDTTVLKSQHAEDGLDPGTYYWRVSTVVDDVEGYFSQNQRLHLFRKLAPPELVANHPPETIYYRSQSPTVGFAWRKSPGADTCYWQLARDKSFKNIVKSQAFKPNDFPQINLKKGIYFWRVGVKELTGRPITYSAIRQIKIIQDQVPPALAVDIPSTAIYGQVYLIGGRTDPEAKVYVGGYQVEVSPDGHFNYALRLKKGKNIIAVAATDQANNVTSKSQIVICK